MQFPPESAILVNVEAPHNPSDLSTQAITRRLWGAFYLSLYHSPNFCQGSKVLKLTQLRENGLQICRLKPCTLCLSISSDRVIWRGKTKQVAEMYNEEDLEALELFNEKAEILKNSTFLKFLIEQKPSIRSSWKDGEPFEIETRWPDEEAVHAFVLTLRFFIQKKERSSFRQMARIYDNLPISQQKKKLFKDARKNLNDFLDSESPFRSHAQAITFREILKVFIYGELAHADEKKREILDKWRVVALFYAMMYQEFLYILAFVTNSIAYVENLNEEVIKELSQNG